MPTPRVVARTAEFERWSDTLDTEGEKKLKGAVDLILEIGPTLGRPHVDVLHGTRTHKLKEARLDRGKRVLFAFDSNRNPVLLVGGDKTGKWGRWYPKKIAQAERLYLDHERKLGKDPGCRTQTDQTRRRGRAR
jgi:hypothetical protein